MSSKLAICVATMQPLPHQFNTANNPYLLINGTGPGQIGLFISNATTEPDVFIRYNTPDDNLGVIGSYQQLYEAAKDYELLAYVHDDVTMRERKWDERVIAEFSDPSVGLVGFGGALHHGSDDLYKTPYKLIQLARDGYLSNVDDAEIHGTRFVESCDVAVLDGFALIVRRSVLDSCGGWPTKDLYFHSYDYWICCIAHELGYRIRVVGVRCHHSGGLTSTSAGYNGNVKTNTGKTDAEHHESSHRYIYERFRSVLPWRC